MKKLKFLLPIVLVLMMLFGFSGQVWALTWTYKNINALSNMTLAPDGTIWGNYNDTIYQYNPTTGSLLNKGAIQTAWNVRSITITPDGTVYACTEGRQIAKYTGSDWVYLTNPFLADPLGYKDPVELVAANDNTVIAFNKGYSVYKLNPTTSSWTYIGPNNNLNLGEMRMAILAPTGYIWVTDDSGHVSYYNGTTWVGVNNPNNSYPINSMIIAEDGSLWVFSNQFVYQWNGSGWTFKGRPRPDGNVSNPCLFKTPSGKVWAYNYDGFYEYSGGTTWTYKGSVQVNELVLCFDGSILIASGGSFWQSEKINLSVSAKTTNSMTLSYSWNGEAVSTTFLKLQKSADNVNFTDVTMTSGSSTTASGLTDGTRYYFRLTYQPYPQYSITNTAATTSTLTKMLVPTINSSTTAGVTWSPTAGYSKVVLNWNAVNGAEGYKVYLFDGNAYQMVQDVGNVTSWDSSVAKIFPSETTIASYGANSQSGNLFKAVTTGLDLRDDPRGLYSKTVGTSYDTDPKYYFKITAYNSTDGETDQSPAYSVQLPDRTDPDPPTGSVVINDGAYNTGDRNLALTITGNDDLSGVAQMQFSNDNISWSPLEPFAPTKTWQVGTDNGSKTVYMKLIDQAGNVSNIISSSINFIQDVLGPTVVATVNEGAVVSSPGINLTINASDNLTPYQNLQMRFSMDTGNTWTAWEGIKFVKALTLPNGDGPKNILVQVKDGAGNITTYSVSVALSTAATMPTGTTTTTSSTVSGTFGSEPVLIIKNNKIALDLGSLQNVSKVQFSMDGVNWSPWEDVSSGSSSYSKNITLGSGDGVKTVYVRFQNTLGKVGDIATQTYYLDTTSPTLSISSVNGSYIATGGRIDFILDVTDNYSTTLYYNYNIATNNNNWTPEQSVTSSSVTVPITGLQSNKYYRINFKVRDQAGNYTIKAVTVWSK